MHFSVFVCFLIVLRVHQLGEDLSRVAGGIKVVGMIAGLLFGSLLAAVTTEDVLVVIEIVVIILIELRLRHVEDCYMFISLS